jgi:hypothetical protein
VRIVRLATIAATAAIVAAVAGNQAVNMYLNATEFGGVYTKNLSYSLLAGLVLAAIALVRVNFASRHSIVWYALRLAAGYFKRDYGPPPKPLRYSEFQMGPLGFALWQVTKVVVLAPFFGSLTFGMALSYAAEGNDIGLGALGGLFGVPFADVAPDGEFSSQTIVPAIPALTLVVPPLIGAVGTRLLLYVGVSGAISIISQYIRDAGEGRPKVLSYISTIELITGAAIFWAGFGAFFGAYVDVNSRYIIAGALLLGATFMAFGALDRRRAKVIIYPTKRHAHIRLATAVAIVAVTGIIVAVNGSIAQTKQVEVQGPYIAQEIAVNRFTAGLDQVAVVDYDVQQPQVLPAEIRATVDENRELLGGIRLWDQEEAEKKLKPEFGQRNDITFVDTDILRFSGTMYWAGSTAPVLPSSLTRGDEWFNRHLVYTHSNTGFKMLAADSGQLVDDSRFFPQSRVYYGESGKDGLFSRYWSAYRADRTTSDEIDLFLYNGTGGVDVSPPLSWLFEPNFMLSDPDRTIHVMRYKDVHDRMALLYPYFAYEFLFPDSPTPETRKLDIFPVTDGTNTYWLVPLIAAFDTSRVPWGSPFMLTLTGYALVDAYNGDVQVIVTGNDPFSQMFYSQYKDLGATRDVPEWLAGQLRYPEEMFVWKTAKFNTYHVTDPKTFIEARQFFDFPKDASRTIPPYYIITRPQGFEESAFVGFQPLELKGSQTKNLVGYMIVENDLDSLGRMTFYSVPLDSPAKLIGPTAAREALDKDREYKNVKTLLQGNPKLGETTLYRLGEHEVYFIPVYTSNTAGGVVSQIGTVAAVGASVTGTFYVGLGDDPVEAFENYLLKSAGEEPQTPEVPGGPPVADLDAQGRIQALEKVFADAGLQIVKPTAIDAPLAFQEAQSRYVTDTEYREAQDAILQFIGEHAQGKTRVFEWQVGDRVNFGVLAAVDGIVENHYISIEVS